MNFKGIMLRVCGGWGTAFKDHVLYNFIYITFSKWQNYRAEKWISVCLGLEMVRDIGRGRWNSKGLA